MSTPISIVEPKSSAKALVASENLKGGAGGPGLYSLSHLPGSAGDEIGFAHVSLSGKIFLIIHRSGEKGSMVIGRREGIEVCSDHLAGGSVEAGEPMPIVCFDRVPRLCYHL
jgi:hypothetical protein